jgi:hypothetical protein
MEEKAKGKVYQSGKKCKVGNNDSDCDAINDGFNQHNPCCFNPNPNPNPNPKPDQAHWVLALQQRYTCQEHGGEYCKVGFGDVYVYETEIK